MTTVVDERPAAARPPGGEHGGNGGAPARRAVVRWGIRLFRREWRQQLLVTALLAVAVAATTIGLAVATNAIPIPKTTFDLPGSDTQVTADVAAVRSAFGPVTAYAHHKVAVPGSVASIDVRATVAQGTGSSTDIRIRSGRLPTATGEVAVAPDVAASFGLRVGGGWTDLGRSLTVVGIIEDSSDLGDHFALVAPGQLDSIDNVTVTVDKDLGRDQVEFFRLPSGAPKQVISESGDTKTAAAIAVLALGTLALLFVGLVGVAGFSVMAHRRQRALGMLGAIGATDAHVRLVVLANGAAVGVVAAVTGAAAGVAGWLVFAPHLESMAGHRIDRVDLPWWALLAAVILAVSTAVASAWWPARAAARTSIIGALSARPPRARSTGRSAAVGVIVVGAGLGLLAFAHPDRGLLVITGTVATVVGVLLLGPLVIRGAATLASRVSIAPRLALRDLARYQARSGAALGAATLAIGIAAIITVSGAAQIAKDSAGQPNLPANELIVYLSADGPHGGPLQQVSDQQLAAARIQLDTIATTVGASRALELDAAINPSSGTLQAPNGPAGRPPVALVEVTPEPGGGESILFKGPLYVATPDVLAQYGIRATDVDLATDILTSRSDLSALRLEYGGLGARPEIANPPTQRVDLPPGTSEPNTLLTTSAVQRLGLQTVPTAWLVRSPTSLTATQIDSARKAAAAGGLTIETQDTHGSLAQLGHEATAGGILFALAVLAMTVGLIRTESANDLRILAATGAPSTTRRAITAATTGTLAVLAALLGTAEAYAVLGAFYRGELNTLGQPPLTDLAVILLILPIIATGAGWLLAGREPPTIARRPLE